MVIVEHSTLKDLHIGMVWFIWGCWCTWGCQLHWKIILEGNF